MFDKAGRPYATVADVGAGDKVRCDGSYFDCFDNNQVVVVQSYDNWLFIVCKKGSRHYIHDLIRADAKGRYYRGLYLEAKAATAVS